jgi:DnaJ family protein C protein 9
MSTLEDPRSHVDGLCESRLRYWVLAGSDDERSDLRAAYLAGNGSVEHIMDAIPLSTYEDEPRLVTLINAMIDAGELQLLPSWSTAIKNTKARNARRKRGEKEAEEAEEAARDLGLGDDFFGGGKARKSRGKGKGTDQSASNDDPEGEDHSALKALIQSKAKKMDGFLDSLAEKYGSASKPASKKGAAGRGRKRAAPAEGGQEEEEERPAKRRGKTKAGVDDGASKPVRGRSAKAKGAKA